MIKFALILLCLCCTVGMRAEYTLNLSSSRGTQFNALPGERFTVSASMSSTASDQLDAAIFRIQFSAPGLIYVGYNWSGPFANQTIEDDSKPRLNQLPASLNANTLFGPDYPAGVVDLELSNTVDGGGHFRSGEIAQLTFEIPADSDNRTFTLTPVPDVFTDGFNEMTTVAGSALQVVVIPEPATWCLFIVFLPFFVLPGKHFFRRIRSC